MFRVTDQGNLQFCGSRCSFSSEVHDSWHTLFFPISVNPALQHSNHFHHNTQCLGSHQLQLELKQDAPALISPLIQLQYAKCVVGFFTRLQKTREGPNSALLCTDANLDVHPGEHRATPGSSQCDWGRNGENSFFIRTQNEEQPHLS